MARPFRLQCRKLPPFKILGELPNGAPDARRVITRDIPEPERTGVFRDCWALANTSRKVSELPRTADMEEEQLTGPIDARSLISAIDRYRYARPTRTGKDLSDQRVSPLDVTLHLCRVVDGLLSQCGFLDGPSGSNNATNEHMAARSAELVHLIEHLAEIRGIDLAVPGPANVAHREAMTAAEALPDD